jgi:histidinol-phosphate/aromatic aminotransferase/cobyric acid decarboxylase-like protein
MDGTVVTLDAQDHIKAFIDKPLFSFQEVDAYYKTVNLYKFSKRFSEETYVPFLDAYTRSLGTNAYYEQVLKVIAQTGNTQIGALRLEGQLWYEIDDVADLDIATTLFADATTRTDLIQRRYGGYWRYPKLLDFCYLVNPCFPPLRLIDEMKANFENLISQYPSGMEVNSLLAAKAFGIQDHNIIVGNGATELIKALMENTDGRVGFIRPTFEEYPNRYPAERSICYTPRSDDFSYTAADLQAYFEGSGIELLVLINPDNPSGNYLPHQSVLELVEWTHAQGIHLVVDESFVDFADEQDASLLNTTFLGENPHVLVVRSISKSFGVPGLRLGILASGSELLIAALKRSVSIWNINSFAEFYLQIEQKYRDDYQAALARFKELRARFLSELTELVGLRVFPTQANYVMAELVCTHTSSLLTERLLGEHAILIKDLTPKLTVQGDSAQPARQFIRLAIRSDEDNRLLIEALRSCL